MSLYDAMMIGVAGLDANSRALSISSSNIANVNTVGYKTSESAFSTMLASSTGGNSAADSSVVANAQQNIVQQGLLFATSSPTDLAISGNGFFAVNTSADMTGQALFTRAGSFTPDADGNLRNSSGLYLEGWPVAPGGATSTDPNALQAINLTNLAGKGEATSTISLQQNLQASDTASTTYNFSTGQTMYSGAVQPEFQRTVNVYDSQGGSQPLQVSYVKTGPNQWAYEVAYSGPNSNIKDSGGNDTNPIAHGTLNFDANGALTSVTDSSGTTSATGAVNVTIPWNPSSGLTSQTISMNFGTLDKSDGTSQFDTDSVMTNADVNGAVFGNVTGVTIDPDGTVNANYSNGLTEAAFKIPLATFADPDGLAQVSGNAFAQTAGSGVAMINPASTAGSGSIASSELEGSTVDLATEFTNMITTQRAYSASARVVTTASQMLDTLMQIQG